MLSQNIALARRPHPLTAPGQDLEFFPNPSGVQHPIDNHGTDAYGDDYGDTTVNGSNNQPINSYDSDYQLRVRFNEMQHRSERANRITTALESGDASNPQPELCPQRPRFPGLPFLNNVCCYPKRMKKDGGGAWEKCCLNLSTNKENCREVDAPVIEPPGAFG